MRKRDEESNPTYNPVKKSKISRNKFNQWGGRLYSGKWSRHWCRKLTTIEMTKKKSHIHELKELVLLKCPSYPKQSTDLMWSLWKYPWHWNWSWNPTVCMEPQKTLNRQRYLGEKTKWTILTIYYKFLCILKHMFIL